MNFVCFLFCLMSLTLSVCGSRFPRELQEISAPRKFWWGEKTILLMNDNGSVEMKRPRNHSCEACEVQLRPLCDTYRNSVIGCPKKHRPHGNGFKIATTLMMMHFNSAQKYLCLHQNKTFYAVEVPDDSNVEECAFYVVQEGPKDRFTSIYHFKYPHKKRNCRLKERRDDATNRCQKFYLRRKGRLLTVIKQKSFNESRWLLVGKKN